MYDLLLRPHVFFARQASNKADLFFPFLIVLSVSGIGLSIALEVSRGMSFNEDFEALRWRISVATSVIAALANLMLWPVVCCITLAVALLLWNRTVTYRLLLAATAYAELPLLIGGILNLILVIRRPVMVAPHKMSVADIQQYLEQETVLGATKYVSAVASVWSGLLMTLAVKYNLRMDVVRSALTVLLPYLGYRLALFLVAIAS